MVEMAMEYFFNTLNIKANSVLFFVVDDTLSEKVGKKMSGCGWYKDLTHWKTHVCGHQWVLEAWLYTEFLFPLGAKLDHPKGPKGGRRFKTKVTVAKTMFRELQFPSPCNVFLLGETWY